MPEINAVQGDVTKQEVDAVVNAANRKMLGGGGLDGAIHRVAGPELKRACREVEEVEPGVRCPTGEARITPGFELPAGWVIHTVGPVDGGKERDAEHVVVPVDQLVPFANATASVTGGRHLESSHAWYVTRTSSAPAATSPRTTTSPW